MKHQFVFLVALASCKGHRCTRHWWYVLTWIIHKPRCCCVVLWCFLNSACEWFCSITTHHSVAWKQAWQSGSQILTALHRNTPKQVSSNLEYSQAEWTSSHLSPLTNCVCLLSAVCFKNAKQYEQAKDAYLKEAEYHTENKTYPICDRSKVDCHDVWLCFVISLTYPTGFFMLPSKCLLY